MTTEFAAGLRFDRIIPTKWGPIKMFTLNAVPKPQHKRGKPSRSSISNLSPKEDKRLKERSNMVCERCDRQRATERAHVVRRHNHSDKPVAEDFLHLCTACHDWCDESGTVGRKWMLQKQKEIRSKG